MASNSKNLYCANKPSSSPYVLAVSFSESNPNVANNTSVISLAGILKSGNGANWISNYPSSLELYWHDNYTRKDTLIDTEKFSSIGLNSTKSVSGSITATHNSDGSLSGYAKVVFTAGSSSGGWCPASAEVETDDTVLTAIARASTFGAITGDTLGSAITLAIKSAASAYTHQVWYKVGDSEWFDLGNDIESAVTFTPPMYLCTHIVDSTFGTMNLCVRTYDGTTQIGSDIYNDIIINIPDSVVPTAGYVQTTPIESDVPEEWGVYVKGHSKVQVSIVGDSGIHESQIESRVIVGPYIGVSQSPAISGVLNSVGTYTFTGKVTDSRGRTASATAEINVEDYFKPSINVTANRCLEDGTTSPSGTYLKVKCTYNYANVKGKNTVRKSIYCNGVYNTDFVSGETFILPANCSIGSTYTLTAEVTDALENQALVTALIPMDIRIINIKKNKLAVAFGMFATEDYTVKSAWDMYAPFLHATANEQDLTIGSSDVQWCNYYTTSEKHWFNKPIYVQGDIYGGTSYNRRVAYSDETITGLKGTIQSDNSECGTYHRHINIGLGLGIGDNYGITMNSSGEVYSSFAMNGIGKWTNKKLAFADEAGKMVLLAKTAATSYTTFTVEDLNNFKQIILTCAATSGSNYRPLCSVIMTPYEFMNYCNSDGNAAMCCFGEEPANYKVRAVALDSTTVKLVTASSWDTAILYGVR